MPRNIQKIQEEAMRLKAALEKPRNPNAPEYIIRKAGTWKLIAVADIRKSQEERLSKYERILNKKGITI